MRRHAGPLFIRPDIAVKTEHRGVGDGIAEPAAANVAGAIATDIVVPEPAASILDPLDPFLDFIVGVGQFEASGKLKEVAVGP